MEPSTFIDVVLDIATGTGNYLIEMAKGGATCYGIDLSPEMVRQAKRKVREQNLDNMVKEIKVGDSEKLPYPNGFFDFVTCIGMLEYYPIQYSRIVLAEIKRVLKLNGKCFVDISNPNSKKAQSCKHTYKYNLKTFDDTISKIGLKILAKNEVETMLQYLLLKKKKK
jgi:ubiquinone/menaquinone biosynthesis C-methylase UbiE